MKEGIYLKNYKVIFQDVNSGYCFFSIFIKIFNEIVEWEDGNIYLVIKVEVSFDMYLFYIGCQKFNEKGGRVEQFKKCYNMGK